MPTPTLLDGPNTYIAWERALRLALREKHITKHLELSLNEIRTAAVARIRLSTPPVARELQLQDNAADKAIEESEAAMAAISSSLDPAVLTMIPDALLQANGEDSNPLALFTWIKSRYGAENPVRKAELIQEVFNIRFEPGTDPRPVAALWKMKTASLSDALKAPYINTPAITAAFDATFGAIYATILLQAAPSDFQLTASSMIRDGNATVQQVLDSMETETHFKMVKEERESSVALLAAQISQHRTANTSPVPRKLGPDGKPILGNRPLDRCEWHQCHGHSTERCHAKARSDYLARTRGESNLPNTAHTGPAISAGPRAMVAETIQECANAEAPESLGPDYPLATSFIAIVQEHTSKALIATTTDQYVDAIIDSGATDSMVNDSTLLQNITALPHPAHIRIGDGRTIPALQTGDLHIGTCILKGVLYAPLISHNLLAVRKFNGTWSFSNGECTLQSDGNTILHGKQKGGLYVVQIPKASPTLLLAAKADLASWHERLGHANAAAIIRLGKAGRLGVWDCTETSLICEPCIMGKGTRLPSLPSDVRATTSLERVSVDLWGPAPDTGRNGERFALTCYDDYTRKIHVYFLHTKSQALAQFKVFAALVETQLNTKIKIIRSDNGGEFISTLFKEYTAQKGIEHHYVPPDAHTQNGRVERAHLTLFNAVRTLLAASGLPKSFWPDAASYAAYTRARIPPASSSSSGSHGKSPEDLWSRRTALISHLQPFGCKLWFRDHRVPTKLDVRYRRGRLLGYVAGTTYYKVWDKEKEKPTTSRDVRFDYRPEDRPNGSTSTSSLGAHGVLGIPTSVSDAAAPLSAGYAPPSARPLADFRDASSPTTNFNINNDLAFPSNHSPTGSPAPIPDALPPSDTPAPELDDLEEPRPANWRGWTETPEPRSLAPSPEPLPAALPADDVPDGPRRTTRFTNRPNYEEIPPDDAATAAVATIQANIAIALVAAIGSSTPNTYREARSCSDWALWQGAMHAELANMAKYGVWTPIPRTSQRTLSGRWVYTRKLDGSTGQPSAYKARFVVKGYNQVEGVDYTELFASVAHKDSIRVFLALVNWFDLECHQVDIKGAFLNGEIDTLIYIDPPEGSSYDAATVLKLNKSLYGLKQSPRLFNQALDRWLRSVGLSPTTADPCVYIRRRNDRSFLMLSVHVDDQLIACNTVDELEEFKLALHKQFECTDTGDVNYFLGFNVYRDRPARTLYISQEHYITSLLDRFGFPSGSNSTKTPFPSNFNPVEATEAEFAAARHLEYPQIAGSILYAATITRPDLAYCAGVLARYISKWSQAHYDAARHLLRYLRGTAHLCLRFDAEAGHRIVLGHADADWGGCTSTRRSTTGYVFNTYGGTVAWRSRRQPTVSLSTTEAEYMASTDATKQAVWLAQLLADLGFPIGTAFPILNDNRGAVELSKNPVAHDKSKHIALRMAFLRENVLKGVITLEHVSTASNTADLLTKALPRELTDRHRNSLGLVPLPEGLKPSTSSKLTSARLETIPDDELDGHLVEGE